MERCNRQGSGSVTDSNTVAVCRASRRHRTTGSRAGRCSSSRSACSPASRRRCWRPARAPAKPPSSNGCSTRRSPTPPVAVPGGKGDDAAGQGHDRRRPGPTSAATRCSGWRRRCGSTAGAPVGGAQILCSTKSGPRTEIARSAEGLRALYPRSSDGHLQPESAGNAGHGLQLPRRRNWRSSKPKTSASPASRRTKASSSNGPNTTKAPSTSNTSSPAASRTRSRTALLHGLENDRDPGGEDLLHRQDQRRQGDREHRGGAGAIPPPIDEEAEERAEEEAEAQEEEEEAEDGGEEG